MFSSKYQKVRVQKMGMNRKRSITGQQKKFVRYHVAERHNSTKAARLAGYAYPKQTAYQLTRNPAILPLMREARQTLYHGGRGYSG
jgi:hypothetical protein